MTSTVLAAEAPVDMVVMAGDIGASFNLNLLRMAPVRASVFATVFVLLHSSSFNHGFVVFERDRL